MVSFCLPQICTYMICLLASVVDSFWYYIGSIFFFHFFILSFIHLFIPLFANWFSCSFVYLFVTLFFMFFHQVRVILGNIVKAQTPEDARKFRRIKYADFCCRNFAFCCLCENLFYVFDMKNYLVLSINLLIYSFIYFVIVKSGCLAHQIRPFRNIVQYAHQSLSLFLTYFQYVN